MEGLGYSERWGEARHSCHSFFTRLAKFVREGQKEQEKKAEKDRGRYKKKQCIRFLAPSATFCTIK
jgi:hypothetical protein